jgi:hypothetical protein
MKSLLLDAEKKMELEELQGHFTLQLHADIIHAGLRKGILSPASVDYWKQYPMKVCRLLSSHHGN